MNISEIYIEDPVLKGKRQTEKNTHKHEDRWMSSEKHIRNGREGMDIHDPDPGLWNRIEAGLPPRERHIGSWLWRAAVILIVAGAGLTVILRTLNAPVEK